MFEPACKNALEQIAGRNYGERLKYSDWSFQRVYAEDPSGTGREEAHPKTERTAGRINHFPWLESLF